MSFRLGKKFERNRFGKAKGAAITHAEDSQPNESIDKRRAVPALVVPSKPRSAELKWGNRGRGRDRYGGYSEAFTTSHTATKLPPHNFAPSPAGWGSGSTSSGSGRVSAVRDASRRQPIPRDLTETVIIQPNPYYARFLMTSFALPQLRYLAPPISYYSYCPHFCFPCTSPITFYLTRLRLPPPSKRQRIEHGVKIKIEEPPSVLPTRAASPPAIRSSSPSSRPVCIKQELRTPSPPPADPPRRSATEGSKRYWPLPDSCKRALNPFNFEKERKDWLRAEHTTLRDLGLQIVRSFFRDDGMVIEWRSDEPVWLDSLRPVQERPHLPVPAGQEIIDVDAESSEPSAVVPSPHSPSRPPIVGPSNSAATSPPPTLNAPIPPLNLEEESLVFVKRYILTFDSKRDALGAAYSEDAFFSFRNNNFACPTSFTFQRKGPSVSQSKPRTMPQPRVLKDYRFSSRTGDILIDYDTVVLEPEPGPGPDAPAATKVLLSMHGQLFGIVDERAQMAIDQTFVLQQNNGVGVTDGGNANESEPWRLLAISHQMVVRDTPWVHWTGTLDDL
ncbi:hypothetical protein MVEN_02623900 [Mycena venus]|uniref:NTF2 domain-containing protein n=1 Tax=Mycena venus TaxID=2733690 RepID=A0A8H6TVX6_9AGAR|nr:hypothetical protein MVEN_02623900 [Mycena venus]